MSRKRFLQIANFDEFQHYKDRNPIWIKLHCAVLDDYEFAQIPDETKFHAFGLMLLASRLNNKFPEDEVWLRRKLSASSEINIELLLEIGFLEVFNEKKVSKKKQKATQKTPTNARKPKKTQGESASTVSKSPLAQNRTEQNKREKNTTQHNRRTETDAENAVAVSVDSFNSSEEFSKNKNNNGHLSRFTLEECLHYVERCQTKGDDIRNPKGLATNLYQTGNSDAFILAMLYPEKQLEIDKKVYGEPVEFTDEPCSVCFGGKMADVDGKGYKPCEHCKNEKGNSTGFEPQI